MVFQKLSAWRERREAEGDRRRQEAKNEVLKNILEEARLRAITVISREPLMLRLDLNCVMKAAEKIATFPGLFGTDDELREMSRVLIDEELKVRYSEISFQKETTKTIGLHTVTEQRASPAAPKQARRGPPPQLLKGGERLCGNCSKPVHEPKPSADGAGISA